jgi:hypothetical protein
MLRSLVFALFGFSLLAGPAAARGGEGSYGGGRRAEAKAVRSAKGERASLLRRVVSTNARSVPSGLACGRTRGGAQRCRGGAVHAVHWRWTQGLPPALGVQVEECPAGTMATLAEGHEDIVRCIPI